MARRAVTAGAAALLLLGGALGYAAADVADVVPGVLTDRPLPTPAPFPPAVGARGPGDPPPPVLEPVGTAAPDPRPAALAAELRPLLADPALGGRVGAVVVDGVTGRQLLARGADRPLEPASVTKLLTAAAALHELGPGHRLATRVVGGEDPGTVVLVGGGDVLLAPGGPVGPGDPAGERAGLAQLADRTAAALAGQGRREVAVRLDDALFGAQRLAPGVTAEDVAAGFTAPLAPLAVAGGRVRPGQDAPRRPDPALAAAQRFAALLAERGVRVRGDVARGDAPRDPRLLAQVHSAPVADLVATMLRDSDNLLADSLAHLVARRTGHPATFAGSGAAVLAVAGGLGVRTGGAVLVDGSGLGEGSALPPRALTDVLVLAGSAEHPRLRPLLTGLPVAGLEGTLGERFTGDAGAAAGLVRAKTGTLTGTTSLAGTVVDADGGYLGFAVLADRVPATAAAREAVDAVAAALAGCGCR